MVVLLSSLCDSKAAMNNTIVKYLAELSRAVDTASRSCLQVSAAARTVTESTQKKKEENEQNEKKIVGKAELPTQETEQLGRERNTAIPANAKVADSGPAARLKVSPSHSPSLVLSVCFICMHIVVVVVTVTIIVIVLHVVLLVAL